MLASINSSLQIAKDILNQEESIREDIGYMISYILKELYPLLQSFKCHLSKYPRNRDVEAGFPNDSYSLWSRQCILKQTQKMIELSHLIFKEILLRIHDSEIPFDKFIECHAILNEKLAKRDIYFEEIRDNVFKTSTIPSFPTPKSDSTDQNTPHTISKFSKCFDSDFVPTNVTIQYLLEHLHSLNKSNLTSLYSDLVESEKDLAGELLLTRQLFFINDSFFSYPNLDIIREHPQYKSMISSINYNINPFRTEYYSFATSINQIIEQLQILQLFFESSFALPRLDPKLQAMAHLIEEDVQLYVKERKLLTFKVIYSQVFKNSDISSVPFSELKSQKFISEEIDLLNHLIDVVKTNPKDLFKELSEVLESSRYSEAKEKISNEIREFEESKRKKEEDRITNIQKQGRAPKPSTRKKLTEMRQEIKLKEEEYNNKRNNFYKKLTNSFESHKQVIQMIKKPDSVNLPSFEYILAEMSEPAAKCQILREKIQQKKIKIQKTKEKTKQHKEKLHDIQNEIEKIRKELAGIQESSKVEEPEATQIEEELSILKDKYFCAACQTRPRDSFFMGCGHTYCNDCIQNSMIKKRSRKCPTCRHIFSPSSDVKTLNFSFN